MERAGYVAPFWLRSSYRLGPVDRTYVLGRAAPNFNPRDSLVETGSDLVNFLLNAIGQHAVPGYRCKNGIERLRAELEQLLGHGFRQSDFSDQRAWASASQHERAGMADGRRERAPRWLAASEVLNHMSDRGLKTRQHIQQRVERYAPIHGPRPKESHFERAFIKRHGGIQS
jgi:hypothetical protein